MKIKQLVPVTNDYAVLATRQEHLQEACYDRKLDGQQYFWAVLDRSPHLGDATFLVQLGKSGALKICECNLVVEKIACPICGQKMFPKHSEKNNPTSWQDCAGCGYRLDTSYDAKDTAGSRIQEIIRGREEDDT